MQQACGLHQEGGKSLRDGEGECSEWKEEAQRAEKVLPVMIPSVQIFCLPLISTAPPLPAA